MGRRPEYFGRRTPLPGTEKRSHLRVVEDRHRREDRHVGMEDVNVKVRPAPRTHDACRRAIEANHPVGVCTRCRWLMGIDDDETRWFDFWVAEGH